MGDVGNIVLESIWVFVKMRFPLEIFSVQQWKNRENEKY
jgi:hypothetical protein